MQEGLGFDFEVLSPKVARLEVKRQGTGPFGFSANVGSPPLLHHLGYREQPLFLLEQPYSSDDAWRVKPLPAGRYIAAQPSSGNKLPNSYVEWLRGSAVSRGQEVPWQLPPGRYLLVRTSRPMRHEPRVLLGNEMVPTSPNMLSLRQEKPFYVCAIGPRHEEAPAVDQPLIGLAVLNFDGSNRRHGLLLFSCVESAPGVAATSGDRVLIVPINGEFVYDNMGQFDPEGEIQSRERWATELVMPFVDWCSEKSLG